MRIRSVLICRNFVLTSHLCYNAGKYYRDTDAVKDTKIFHPIYDYHSSVGISFALHKRMDIQSCGIGSAFIAWGKYVQNNETQTCIFFTSFGYFDS